MDKFKAGDLVRVKDGCASVRPGTIFRITRITEQENPYTWNGLRHVPNPDKPNWYAMGDPYDTGVWAHFLEAVTEESQPDRLEQVRAYIREHEHRDDWNVPCVYTKALREILGMEESPL